MPATPGLRFTFCAMAVQAGTGIIGPSRNHKIPARMKCTLITPAELDATTIRRWEELRAGNPVFASPFYSPNFAKAVGEVRRDAQVAIFERGGRIDGFLPFHRVRNHIAKPIGGHFNDYHGAILAPDLQLADAGLIEFAGIEAYDFDHLPAPLGSGTGAVAAGQGSPRMHLPLGYEQCVAAKGDSWRRGYRDLARKARKMERELGPIRFEFASASADLFNSHAAMRNALYRKMGQRADYFTGWEGDVLNRLRGANGPDLRSVLSVLFAGPHLVAAHFGMVSRGALHWWFPAYALAAHRYSPGLQLIDRCARQAASEGITIIDFGKGDERYKTLFADHSMPLLRGSVCGRSSLAGRLRTRSAQLLGAAERVLPAAVAAHPRRLVDRLWTGTVLPRPG